MLVPVIFSVSVFTRYQIQPVSVFFERYCCTVSFGGNAFLSFHGNSFFEKFRGNSFFSSKGGWSVQRGGRGPPFLGKRGLLPIFWGATAKFLIPKILTEFSFGIGMVNTEKYQPIPTEIYWLGIQLYKLHLGKRLIFLVVVHWLLSSVVVVCLSVALEFPVLLFYGTSTFYWLYILHIWQRWWAARRQGAERTTMAMGDTTTVRVSRATGSTTMAMGGTTC